MRLRFLMSSRGFRGGRGTTGGFNRSPAPISAWDGWMTDGSGPDAKHLLQVSDRVLGIVATHEPALRAPASQESAEVIGINQDSCIDCQGNHLFWRAGVKELVLNLGIIIHLMAEMIEGIQKRL